MLKFTLLLFFMQTLNSCAGHTVKRTSSKTELRPAWLYEAEKGCNKNEMCAVGEAVGSLGADVSARKNLTKIFETKITSSLIQNTKSFSVVKDQVVTGEVNESVREKVEEQTDQVLRGVIIREIYEGEDAFYALAVLNKVQAAKGIALEVEAIDIEMLAYHRDGRRSYLNKALKRHYVRSKLAQRHYFLIDKKLLSPVSLGEILDKKKRKRNLGTTIFVRFKEVGNISKINHLIITHLLENDFKVVTISDQKASYSLKGNLKKEKLHMKVIGFEKFKFSLQLESQNKLAQKIGALEYSTTHVGRNVEHAYENAIPEIKKFLEENLDELNID